MDSRQGVAASDNSILVKNLQSKSDLLKVGHFNAQSLNPANSKFEEIKLILKDSLLDVVGVSETWLKSYITNKSVEVPGYKIIRHDRPAIRGGGVAFYVSKKLKTRVISRSEGSDVEYLFMEVVSVMSRVLVGVIYRPRGSLTSLDDELSQILPNYDNVILMGDFNLNLLQDSLSTSCASFFRNFGLDIIHNSLSPTHYDVVHNSLSLIDYFAVANRDSVVFSDQFWIPGVSKHAFIYLACKVSAVKVEQLFQYRDYKNINLSQLLYDATLHNFNDVFLTNDVNRQLNILNTAFLSLFNSHVPVRTKKPRNLGEPWYSTAIASAKADRDLAFRAYRENRTPRNWKNFCMLRNIVTRLVRDAKRQFWESYFSPSQSSSQLWRKIKNVGISEATDHDSSVASPDEFNRFFTSSQLIAPVRDINHDTGVCDGFSFRNVVGHELYKAIFSIKSNAVGLDGIPLRFIKLVFPAVSVQILHVINTIFTTSTFPSEWKFAKVLPVPKNSNPGNLGDYRPISILPALSKCWEILAKDQMVEHLDINSLLFANQSGFRKNHSTTTTILDVTESIRVSMDSKQPSILVLLDFSKAFDCIDHSILQNKLKHNFSFASTSCNMLCSYLSGRSQCVVLGEAKSTPLPMVRGVPQGSVLGPLIFSLYINDLPTVTKYCSVHIFADDVQLISSAPLDNLDECVSNLNTDLAAVSSWSFHNGLSLNPNKTQAIAIYKRPIKDQLAPVILGSQVIQYVSQVSTLGTILNETLSWDDHISHLRGKLFNIMRKLYSLTSFVPFHIRKLLAKALVMPHFTYGCEIYSGGNIQEMRRVKLCFNTMVRYVYSLSRYAHISEYVNSFLGCAFDNWVKNRVLIMLFKVIRTKLPVYIYNRLIFARSTRTNNIILPRHSSSIMSNSFILRSARLWNRLHVNTRSSSTLAQFKSALAVY